jgi:hypothetical protein
MEVAGKPGAIDFLRDLYKTRRDLPVEVLAKSWGFPLDKFQVN